MKPILFLKENHFHNSVGMFFIFSSLFGICPNGYLLYQNRSTKFSTFVALGQKVFSILVILLLTYEFFINDVFTLKIYDSYIPHYTYTFTLKLAIRLTTITVIVGNVLQFRKFIEFLNAWNVVCDVIRENAIQIRKTVYCSIFANLCGMSLTTYLILTTHKPVFYQLSVEGKILRLVTVLIDIQGIVFVHLGCYLIQTLLSSGFIDVASRIKLCLSHSRCIKYELQRDRLAHHKLCELVTALNDLMSPAIVIMIVSSTYVTCTQVFRVVDAIPKNDNNSKMMFVSLYVAATRFALIIIHCISASYLTQVVSDILDLSKYNQRVIINAHLAITFNNPISRISIYRIKMK